MITADTLDVPLEAGRARTGSPASPVVDRRRSAGRRGRPTEPTACAGRAEAAAPTGRGRAPSRPTSRCSIGRMADPDVRRTDPTASPRGFATRAIRAAHRLPVRRPAPDLGPDLPDRHVLGRRRRGARRGHDRPASRATPTRGSTTRRSPPSPPRSPSSRAPRPGSPSRRAWPRSTRALGTVALGRRPGRRDPGRRTARPAPSSTERLRPARRRRPSSSTSPTSPRSRRRWPRPRPGSSTPRRSRTRRSSSPTTPPSPTLAHRHGALLHRRQHVRLAVPLPAGRARRRPRRRVGDEVPGRPLRRAGRRRRRRRASLDRTGSATSRSTPGATLAPHAAFLVAARARRRSRSGWSATRRPPRPWRPGSRASRASRGSSTRRLASHPQHEVATRQLARGGGMLAFELAGGRGARGDGRSSTPSRSRSGRPRSAASTRSSATRRRRPIASSTTRQLADGRDHGRACCAARSGSRTSTT